MRRKAGTPDKPKLDHPMTPGERAWMLKYVPGAKSTGVLVKPCQCPLEGPGGGWHVKMGSCP